LLVICTLFIPSLPFISLTFPVTLTFFFLYRVDLYCDDSTVFYLSILFPLVVVFTMMHITLISLGKSKTPKVFFHVRYADVWAFEPQ